MEAIDKILDQVTSTPTHQIASELTTLARNQKFEATEFAVLVNKIFERAWRDLSLWRNYTDLVHALRSLSFIERWTKMTVTFKDVFDVNTINLFESFYSQRVEQVGDVDKARFFARLHTAGLVSSLKVDSWITSLAHHPQCQTAMLNEIKPRECIESSRDKCSQTLRQIISERTILQADCGYSRCPINVVSLELLNSRQIPSQIFYPSRTLPREPVNAVSLANNDSNTFCDNLESTQASANNTLKGETVHQAKGDRSRFGRNDLFSIPQDFKSFLTNIGTDEQPAFDLGQFKTCSDEVKSNCADILIECSMVQPGNLVAFAQLARRIQCGYTVRQHRTFNQFLSDSLKTEIKQCSRNFSSRTSSLGIFIGHSYVLECTRIEILVDWLEKVSNLITKDHISAVKSLLNVLRIVLSTMKTKHPRQSEYYHQQVLNFSNHRQIPEEFLPWVRKLSQTDNYSKKKKRHSSSQQLCSSNSQAIPSSVHTKPTQQSFTEEFQDFLENISNSSPPTINLDQFRTCSNDIRKNCAQIFFKQMIANPKNIKQYVELTHDIVSSHSGSSTVHATFLVHLTGFCCTAIKMSECFNKESTQFKTLGEFIAQLYLLGCITRPNLISKWLNEAAKRASRNDETAARAFLSVFESVAAGKLSVKGCFDLHLEQLQELSYQNKIPSDNKQWADYLLQNKSISGVEPSQGNESANEDKSSSAIRESTPIQLETMTIHQNTNNSYKVFLLAFKSQTLHEVDKAAEELIGSFNDKDDVMRFTQLFFEVIKLEFDCVAYVRLAQLIERKIKARMLPFSFISDLGALFWKCWIDFLPLESIQENKALRDVNAIVRIAGVLYIVDCINSDQIFQMMEFLAMNENFMESLRVLIQIISMTFVGRAEFRMSRNFVETLQARKKTAMHAINYLIYQDLIDNFESIVNLLNPNQVNIDKELIESMISDLVVDRTSETAEVMKSLKLELNTIVDALISNALQSPTGNKVFARLGSELQNMSVKSDNSLVTSLRKLLADKCKYSLVNNLSGGTKLYHLRQTLNMIDFIGELFLVDLVDSDYILMCLKIIDIDESDNAAEYASFLMTKTGAKLDMQESKKMNEIFKKWQDISREEDSYRAEVYKNLIYLRSTYWMWTGSFEVIQHK